jgi:hypothetical protein
MDEYTIRQAIDLIKANRLTDARKLLRPVLEVSPENEAAWIWFSSTFLRTAEQLEVLRYAIQFCPVSQPITRGISRLELELNDKRGRGEEMEPIDVDQYLPVLRGQRHSPVVESSKPDSREAESNIPAQGFTPIIQTEEPSEADWIDSLRSAAISDDPDEEAAEAIPPEQHDPDQGTEHWQREFSDSQQDISHQTEPMPAHSYNTDPLPSIPQARTISWDGQGIGFEAEEVAPYLPEMSVAPEEQFSYEQPKTTSPKPPLDPYRVLFFVAATLGVVLALLVIIFLVTIVMMAFA